MVEDQSIFRHNDGLIVKMIVNKPVNSNCFVLYAESEDDCIVVDPGTEDCLELLSFLEAQRLSVSHIILTHEHFDHIWGTNVIKDRYSSKIVCTALCAEKIVFPKKNMSIFFNQVGFSTYEADISIESIDRILSWNGYNIHFIDTPGHTDSSLSFFINNSIFAGDLMISGVKTVTKLPSGNKMQLQDSLSMVKKTFEGKMMTVFPGHGDVFRLDEINIEDFL